MHVGTARDIGTLKYFNVYTIIIIIVIYYLLETKTVIDFRNSRCRFTAQF